MKFLLYLLLFFTISAAAQTDTLYVLATTDVHGRIWPYNYFTDTTQSCGLAKIYTLVSKYKTRHKSVVLLDNGDLLQGTPLAYYFNKVETAVPNPLILTLNYMHYDAFTVGNHDIEQGPLIYLALEQQSRFPWLAANSRLPDGSTLFAPYTVIQKGPLKVGVIGLTTPAIPLWLDSTLYPGVTWQDMVQSARITAQKLRPRVDVLVGLFHAGLDSAYSAAITQRAHLPNENASALVAQKVPLFDMIISGHSHKPYPLKGMIKEDQKPLVLNGGSWGKYLTVAQLILKKDKDNPWQIIKKQGWLENTEHVPPASAILQLTEYYHRKTLTYIRQPIARITNTITMKQARFADHPIVELINRAQMHYSGADLSFAAAFNTNLTFKPGPLHIKDVYSIYPYENFLYVVEMSGKQILKYLNYCARYYSWQKDKPAANQAWAGYNYDMAEGIRYVVHITDDPQKNYVSDVQLMDGRPLEKNKIYRVALNSYRATGGGGHLSAAGIEKPRIVYKSDQEIRNLLVAYIRSQGKIDGTVNKNWRWVRD